MTSIVCILSVALKDIQLKKKTLCILRLYLHAAFTEPHSIIFFTVGTIVSQTSRETFFSPIAARHVECLKFYLRACRCVIAGHPGRIGFPSLQTRHSFMLHTQVLSKDSRIQTETGDRILLEPLIVTCTTSKSNTLAATSWFPRILNRSARLGSSTRVTFGWTVIVATTSSTLLFSSNSTDLGAEQTVGTEAQHSGHNSSPIFLFLLQKQMRKTDGSLHILNNEKLGGALHLEIQKSMLWRWKSY